MNSCSQNCRGVQVAQRLPIGDEGIEMKHFPLVLDDNACGPGGRASSGKATQSKTSWSHRGSNSGPLHNAGKCSP